MVLSIRYILFTLLDISDHLIVEIKLFVKFFKIGERRNCCQQLALYFLSKGLYGFITDLLTDNELVFPNLFVAVFVILIFL